MTEKKKKKKSLRVQSVSKRYGNQQVLKDISFDLEAGRIVGLLGPNGAGKSTLMKIITTYVTPDEGEVFVNGFSVRKEPMEVRKQLGYLPEHNPLYSDMYVREYLSFVAGFYPDIDSGRMEEVMQLTGLMPEAHKKIGQLSKGYRQRVGLAAAIIHDPPVLILDEPTTGLDPNQLIEIRSLIKNLGQNKSIILSTHIMQEVEQMADRVLILHHGKILLDKNTEEITTGNQLVEITFDVNLESRWFQEIPGFISAENTGENTWRLIFENTEDIRPLLFDFAVRNGLKILHISTSQTRLEEIFREVTHRA